VFYDLAGNVVFHTTEAFNPDLFAALEDRASFYGADGRLRAAEYRRLQVSDPADTVFVDGQWVVIIPQWKWPWFRSFEEYRYDALGRRVLVRTRKHCGGGTVPTTGYLTYCSTGTIRRTVWSGDQELYEIQAYGGQEDGTATVAQMENDTLLLPVTPVSHPQGYWDPNPLFGRVAYTHGPALDQPVGAIRINLTDIPYEQTQVDWAPIVVAPHWNLRGRADLGTLGDGGWKVCQSPTSQRCMHPVWEVQSFAFLQPFQDAGRWFGTLIREKEDWVGLQYRRNRYLDPATGRFTQEDPIGLAGGLNLYGFAAGDPVNFSDPFGLCPPELTGRPCLLPLNDKPFLRGSFDNPRIGEFGMVRDGGTRPHQGIDILGTQHTLALAADEGVVTFAGEREGYGLMVEIGHANAEGKVVSYTAYAHLGSASVKRGQRVSAGEGIGVMGRSGNVPVDAPTQLHFEIRTRSMPGRGLDGRLDPLDQFPQLIKVP